MAEPKGGLVYVAGESEEAKSANQAYQDALQKLTASLEARQNRFFDPTLLAIAEGMLGPTRTGSFSEALGRSAEKLRQSQEEELKQEQQIAQARLGLAERGITLAQQRQREQDYAQELQRLGYPAPADRPQPSEDQRVVASPVPMTRESRVPGLTVTTDEIDARKELPQRQIAAAASVAPPPGYENSRSFQVAPPNIGYVDPIEHLRMRGKEGKLSLAEARKEVSEMQKDRYVYRDNAVFDKASGRIYYIPTGDVVEISTSRGPQKIPKEIVRLATESRNPGIVEAYVASLPTTAELIGREAGARAAAERGQAFKEEMVQLPLQSGGTGEYPLGPEDAFRFQQIRRDYGINSPQALAFAARFTGEQAPAGALPTVRPEGGPLTPPRPAAPPTEVPAVPPRVAAEAPPPALPRQPSEAPPAATPDGVPEPRPRVKTASERAAESAAATAAATKRAEDAAVRESKLGEIRLSATELEGVTNRLSKIVDESGKFLGIFARPGLGPAMLGLVQDSFRTGKSGFVEAPTLEDAVRKIMPGVKRSDISNIQKAQADFSNIELLYRKTFLTGQGAVSNMEGQVVARLGGTTSSTPETIAHRMKLIRARAQFDRADVDQFNEWKSKNPNKNYFDWQSTPQYRQLLNSYENKLNEVEQGYLKQQEAPKSVRGTWNPKTKSWEF